AATWTSLRELADGKHTTVVIGPGTPTRDEFDRPLAGPAPKRVGRLKAGSLDDLRGLAGDLAALAELPDAWQVERPDDVRAAAFDAPDGSTRVVFVTSDAPRAVTASLLVPGGVIALRDPLAAESLRVTGGRAAIAMPARGVRMFVVER
ncbi:MAG TPA: hypothetical protein VGF94_09200, partial [Kofleriaceae bacterium]